MAKILVVDDEPGVVLWVRYALEFEGYQVVSAGSGGEALAAAGRERADLLILDRMLPDMDGEDVCRALRNMPSTARLPILMFSVRSGEPDRASGLSSGADDYMGKPVEPDVLVARVGAMLEATRAGAGEQAITRMA